LKPIIYLFLLLSFCQKPAKIETSESVLTAYKSNLELAKKSNRKILLVFGASWCIDCRTLDQFMNRPEVSEIIQKDYILQKVDVGDFDKNLGFVNLFDVKLLDNGIPALVILDKEEKILSKTLNKEFSNSSKNNSDRIFEYLKKFAEIK
jgi:thioredoxin 1